VFPWLVFSFKPLEKQAKIRGIDVVEPTAVLFEVKSLRNINGVGPEVVEIPRDESELLVLLKLAMGAFGLLLLESALDEVIPSRKLLIHPQCVNELPVARAFLTRPAGTYDPIPFSANSTIFFRPSLPRVASAFLLNLQRHSVHTPK
jgi:hypothetical protein